MDPLMDQNELDETMLSYLDTDYFVRGFGEPIQIGSPHAESDAQLKAMGYESFAYITAYNPISVLMTSAENEVRNVLLKGELNGWDWREGASRARSGKWDPEPSFWIGGIDLVKAVRIAWRFQQQAILFGRVGEASMLVETIRPVGDPAWILPYLREGRDTVNVSMHALGAEPDKLWLCFPPQLVKLLGDDPFWAGVMKEEIGALVKKSG